jgi:hypothetical protein
MQPDDSQTKKLFFLWNFIVMVKSSYLIDGELRLFQNRFNRHEKLMSSSYFLTFADEYGKDGAIGLRNIYPPAKLIFFPSDGGLSVSRYVLLQKFPVLLWKNPGKSYGE